MESNYIKSEKLFFTALIIAIVILFILGIAIGSTYISMHSILSAFLGKEGIDNIIIFKLRIPRTIMTLCVGGSLALSGTLMQSVFKNPMADPYIIGVSSGASLGAVIAISSGFAAKFLLATPLLAFIIAITTSLLVYKISLRNGISDTSTLLLSGIAISALLGSIINFLLYSTMEEFDAAKEILFWIMGSFEGKTTIHMLIVLPISLLSFFITLRYRRVLDIISLGDIHAQSLGINIQAKKREIIIIASILTSVSVSMSGMIGFVGLIIPHISRLLKGSLHKNLVPTSFLLGGIFLTLIDLFVRILSPHMQIRIGILTSLIGSPFFLYLLIKNKKRTSLGGF